MKAGEPSSDVIERMRRAAAESRTAIETEGKARLIGSRLGWCRTCRQRHPPGFVFGGRWRPWHETRSQAPR